MRYTCPVAQKNTPSPRRIGDLHARAISLEQSHGIDGHSLDGTRARLVLGVDTLGSALLAFWRQFLWRGFIAGVAARPRQLHHRAADIRPHSETAKRRPLASLDRRCRSGSLGRVHRARPCRVSWGTGVPASPGGHRRRRCHGTSLSAMDSGLRSGRSPAPRCGHAPLRCRHRNSHRCYQRFHPLGILGICGSTPHLLGAHATRIRSPGRKARE